MVALPSVLPVTTLLMLLVLTPNLHILDDSLTALVIFVGQFSRALARVALNEGNHVDHRHDECTESHVNAQCSAAWKLVTQLSALRQFQCLHTAFRS